MSVTHPTTLERLHIQREGVNRLEEIVAQYKRHPGFDPKGRSRAVRLFRLAKRCLKELEGRAGKECL